jgi:hypothetical protein
METSQRRYVRFANLVISFIQLAAIAVPASNHGAGYWLDSRGSILGRGTDFLSSPPRPDRL